MTFPTRSSTAPHAGRTAFGEVSPGSCHLRRKSPTNLNAVSRRSVLEEFDDDPIQVDDTQIRLNTGLRVRKLAVNVTRREELLQSCKQKRAADRAGITRRRRWMTACRSAPVALSTAAGPALQPLAAIRPVEITTERFRRKSSARRANCRSPRPWFTVAGRPRWRSRKPNDTSNRGRDLFRSLAKSMFRSARRSALPNSRRKPRKFASSGRGDDHLPASQQCRRNHRLRTTRVKPFAIFAAARKFDDEPSSLP